VSREQLRGTGGGHLRVRGGLQAQRVFRRSYKRGRRGRGRGDAWGVELFELSSCRAVEVWGPQKTMNGSQA
jgi:hypothetical protein